MADDSIASGDTVKPFVSFDEAGRILRVNQRRTIARDALIALLVRHMTPALLIWGQNRDISAPAATVAAKLLQRQFSDAVTEYSTHDALIMLKREGIVVVEHEAAVTSGNGRHRQQPQEPLPPVASVIASDDTKPALTADVHVPVSPKAVPDALHPSVTIRSAVSGLDSLLLSLQRHRADDSVISDALAFSAAAPLLPQHLDRVRCMRYDFDSVGPGEMSVPAGEHVLLLPQRVDTPSGWTFVYHADAATGATRSGHVPTAYLGQRQEVQVHRKPPIADSPRSEAPRPALEPDAYTAGYMHAVSRVRLQLEAHADAVSRRAEAIVKDGAREEDDAVRVAQRELILLKARGAALQATAECVAALQEEQEQLQALRTDPSIVRAAAAPIDAEQPPPPPSPVRSRVHPSHLAVNVSPVSFSRVVARDAIERSVRGTVGTSTGAARSSSMPRQRPPTTDVYSSMATLANTLVRHADAGAARAGPSRRMYTGREPSGVAADDAYVTIRNSAARLAGIALGAAQGPFAAFQSRPRARSIEPARRLAYA